MKTQYLLKLTFALLIFILTSCSKDSTKNDNLNCDTTYYVQYSDSPSFENILLKEKIYQKSKVNYTMKPKTMDISFWTGENKSVKRPDINQYYARIIGMCNENTFFTSETRCWKNIGTSLGAIISKEGVSKPYRSWIDITNYNDSTDAYILTDTNGNQILHNKTGDHKVKMDK